VQSAVYSKLIRMTDALGWVVWGGLAAYTGVLWHSAVRNANGGIRFLSATCALFFTTALAFVLATGVPKLHLAWAAVVIYALAMVIGGRVIESRVRSAPGRAEAESKRTGENASEILERELERLGYGPDQPSSG
jgi:hypothetical protein